MGGGRDGEKGRCKGMKNIRKCKRGREERVKGRKGESERRKGESERRKGESEGRKGEREGERGREKERGGEKKKTHLEYWFRQNFTQVHFSQVDHSSLDVAYSNCLFSEKLKE